MRSVAIIDYGLGNISSICSAFSYLSADPNLTSDRDQISRARHLVLPGVGAFRDGMRSLAEKGLIDTVRDYCLSDRPFLGICLGMQMLVEESEEFGLTTGLRLIQGRNIRIPQTGINGKFQKVPHIGWAPIKKTPAGGEWNGTILDGLDIGTPFYFVHSYTVKTDNDNSRLAETDYNGHSVSAVIRKGNVYGTQFHPEKSGEAGLHILENFLKL